MPYSKMVRFAQPCLLLSVFERISET